MAKNWFDHDYNARNDEKVLEIRARHGVAGYGLYFMLIECLAENHGYIPQKRLGGISIGLGVTQQFMQEFVDDCMECELLALNEDNCIYSPRLLKHVEKVKALSDAGKKGVEIREQNRLNKANLSHAEATLKPPLSLPLSDKNRIEENNTIGDSVESPKRSVFKVDADKVERIYAEYPRKESKQQGLKAIAKAITKLHKQGFALNHQDTDYIDKVFGAAAVEKLSDPYFFLFVKTKRYAILRSEKPEEEKQFTPHPATWYNSERYFDI